MNMNQVDRTGKLYSLVEFYGRFYASFYRRDGKCWKPIEKEVSKDTFLDLLISNYGRLDAANSDTMVRLYN